MIMSDMFPPAPIPPWHRPVVSPTNQEINEDLVNNGISLNTDVTYLISNVPKNSLDAAEAYQVAIPNGNYKRQIKRIFIPKANELTTAAFEITGEFLGFTKLRFDKEERGVSAVLEWVGDGWSLIGGNAGPIP